MNLSVIFHSISTTTGQCELTFLNFIRFLLYVYIVFYCRYFHVLHVTQQCNPTFEIKFRESSRTLQLPTYLLAFFVFYEKCIV